MADVCTNGGVLRQVSDVTRAAVTALVGDVTTSSAGADEADADAKRRKLQQDKMKGASRTGACDYT